MGLIVLDMVLWMLGICCQIPLLDEARQGRPETAGSGTSPWLWASLAAGIAFASLSLSMTVWLAIRLL